MGLFKPAWQCGNQERALKALSKLTTQTDLVRVVKESQNDHVRCEAVRRMTDQSSIESIMTDELMNPAVRAEAIKIHPNPNQDFIISLSKDKRLGSLCHRIEAINRLKDQTLLKQLACDEQEAFTTRSSALECISDQEILLEIIKNDRCSNFAQKVLRKINDQKVLAEIALAGLCQDKDLGWVIRKLTDVSVLEKIVSEGGGDRKNNAHRVIHAASRLKSLGKSPG